MPCNFCGAITPVQCTCPTPYCTDVNECPIKLDSACVIYHIEGDQDTPSLLNCINLPNGSTVESILEAIDTLICNQGNISIEVTETFTTKMTANGPANHHLKTDVKVSEDDNNTVEIRPDGLFVHSPADETDLTANDSSTIDFTTSGTANHTLTGDVKISEDANNIISAHSDGIYAAPTAETSLTANDSSTIDFSTSGTAQHTLTGSVKVSPDAGNIISAHGNGIFAAASDELTFDNGLTRTSDNTQIGGDILHDTVLEADHTTTNTLNISTTVDIDNTLYTGLNSFLIREGSAFTQSATEGSEFGTGGQLWYKPTGNVALRGSIANFSGVYGIAIKSGSGNVTNNILSGGYFTAAAADSGNVESLAGVRIGHVIDPPAEFGGTFTGSITNYYGLYIEAASASEGNPTNKYGAYILGSGSGFENVVQTDWTVTSDSRIKENVVPTKYGLKDIEKLNVVEFNYTFDNTKDLQLGFIAQDVETILPEAVSKRPMEGFDDFRLLDKNVIFSVLVNAVKELSEKVKALEQKLNN